MSDEQTHSEMQNKKYQLMKKLSNSDELAEISHIQLKDKY